MPTFADEQAGVAIPAPALWVHCGLPAEPFTLVPKEEKPMSVSAKTKESHAPNSTFLTKPVGLTLERTIDTSVNWSASKRDISYAHVPECSRGWPQWRREIPAGPFGRFRGRCRDTLCASRTL